MNRLCRRLRLAINHIMDTFYTKPVLRIKKIIENEQNLHFISKMHSCCTISKITLAVSKKPGYRTVPSMGHRKPRSPKIQLKVTVQPEHRVMLRWLAMVKKRNMGDVLGELISREWKKIRNKEVELGSHKLLKKNIEVALAHELYTDDMALFDDWIFDDIYGRNSPLQKLLTRFRTILKRIKPSWFSRFDE